MKIQNVKGGYDYLPNAQRIRNYINRILKETFEEYGYMPIETPILCYYDILSEKYDEESDILNEIYKLTDQGNRKLGLRYDLTVPFAKMVALNKNNLSFPFKRYEIAKVFRDGPVKLGRDREFTQCDVDVVGIDGQLIEAELLDLYSRAFKKLNIDIVIKYNNRKLMNGLLMECKIEENKISNIITAIDKLKKITKEEFRESLVNIGIDKKQIQTIEKIFSMELPQLEKYFENTKNITLKEGLMELKSLKEYLDCLKIGEKCEIDITLARGQNYYTGNVFEVYEKNNKLSCSIGAGGRYDKMITNFIDDGNNYPAVGISFGLSSIYELLKETSNAKANIDILIIPINTEKESLVLAQKLRNRGYKVEIEMKNKKIKKALERADRDKISNIIIYGEDEVKSKKFNLKNMETKEENLIYFDKI